METSLVDAASNKQATSPSHAEKAASLVALSAHLIVSTNMGLKLALAKVATLSLGA